MFLHVSVILFTGGGGGFCPIMHHRSHDWGEALYRGSLFRGGLCPRESLSGGVFLWMEGVSFQEGSLYRGSLFRGGLCPRESLSGGVFLWVEGVSFQEGSLSGGLCLGGLSRVGSLCKGGGSVRETPRQKPPYWNAFFSTTGLFVTWLRCLKDNLYKFIDIWTVFTYLTTISFFCFF